MKIPRGCIPILSVLALITGAAQAHTPATSARMHQHSRADAGADAEVRSLYARWTKAFEARDLEAIMALYAPEDAVVAYDITPPLQYRGKTAYRKDYQEFLALYNGPLHVEYRDSHVVSGGDVGVFYALERISGSLKNGQRSDLWLRATSVARRIGGKWFIVHDHVSVPTDFETGKAMLSLKPSTD